MERTATAAHRLDSVDGNGFRGFVSREPVRRAGEYTIVNRRRRSPRVAFANIDTVIYRRSNFVVEYIFRLMDE